MSHVAVQKTEKGKPVFADLACLIKAAELKGWEKVDTCTYHWYGTHVGDYPVPEGVNVAEIGSNALFVLRMKEEEKKRLGITGTPYDVGVIADPNNPGCYTLIYDFWAGGLGVDKSLGYPVREKGEIILLCPELKQTYDMVCDSVAAKEAGDNIVFMTLEQAREQFPEHFANVLKKENEAKTWISMVDENRTKVKAGWKSI